ncbi:LysE family transporter [Brevibacillus ruminantium]|uniref:LysE family transporter n=1 Tax=Brevibacillus ruminantium TaxID=2950604 RepID=A0ABY4WEN4_9BACL|nr:LysE family transporter [Brevibacillus ruminantium]USG65623.1 LysE family transporter [Brevibacillus ruminantium]
MQWVPFLLYVFVTSFTPGPNNFISMTSAAKVGFRKTLWFILGVTTGTTVIALMSSYFHLLLSGFLPKMKTAMSILGALYLVYLAVKIMTSRSEKNDLHEEKTYSFFTGFLLQFINPKAILYGITAISSFVIPFYQSQISLIFFSFFLGFVGFLSTSSWASFGALFHTWISKHERVFNIGMGVLLLYSAVFIFI